MALQELEAEVQRLKELVRVADEDKQALDLCADRAANEIERLRKVCTNFEHRVLELTTQVSMWPICVIQTYANTNCSTQTPARAHTPDEKHKTAESWHFRAILILPFSYCLSVPKASSFKMKLARTLQK